MTVMTEDDDAVIIYRMISLVDSRVQEMQSVCFMCVHGNAIMYPDTLERRGYTK